MDEDLLFRSLTGRATADEESAVRAWREAAREHEDRYRELGRLLRLSTRADAVRRGRTPAPDATKLLEARERKLSFEPFGEVRRTLSERGGGGGVARTRRRWGLGLGITAIAATALGVFGVPPVARNRAPEFVFGAGEFVTGPTETVTATLGDGSVVRLAPNSVLRVIAGRTRRDVFLNGRAFFAVARMPDRPFRVLTRAGEARVLGTRFEAKVAGEELRVVVLEGRVRLAGEREGGDVTAGHLSFVSNGTVSRPVAVDDIRPMIDWLDRFIVFQATPVRDVAAELERQYGIPVRVRGAELMQETVTGWYADRQFEEVFAVVCGVLRAECTIRDSVATMRR